MRQSLVFNIKKRVVIFVCKSLFIIGLVWFPTQVKAKDTLTIQNIAKYLKSEIRAYSTQEGRSVNELRRLPKLDNEIIYCLLKIDSTLGLIKLDEVPNKKDPTMPEFDSIVQEVSDLLKEYTAMESKEANKTTGEHFGIFLNKLKEEKKLDNMLYQHYKQKYVVKKYEELQNLLQLLTELAPTLKEETKRLIDALINPDSLLLGKVKAFLQKPLPVSVNIRLGYNWRIKDYPEVYKIIEAKIEEIKEEETQYDQSWIFSLVIVGVIIVVGFLLFLLYKQIKPQKKSAKKASNTKQSTLIQRVKKIFVTKKKEKKSDQDNLGKGSNRQNISSAQKPPHKDEQVQPLDKATFDSIEWEEKIKKIVRKELEALNLDYKFAKKNEVRSLIERVVNLESKTVQKPAFGAGDVTVLNPSSTNQTNIESILYAATVSKSGFFTKITSTKNSKAYFILEVLLHDTNKAMYRFIEEKASLAIKRQKDVLQDTCIYQNDFYKEGNEINPKTSIRNLKPGEAINQQGEWKITKKALIEFYD